MGEHFYREVSRETRLTFLEETKMAGVRHRRLEKRKSEISWRVRNCQKVGAMLLRCVSGRYGQTS